MLLFKPCLLPSLPACQGDVGDQDLLRPLLDAGAFDAVIHFAAKK